MNPTLYRHEVMQTNSWISESEWAEAWRNYKPVMIVEAPKPTPEAGMDCAFDNGFREACIRVLEMADEYFVVDSPIHKRFTRIVSGMYNGRL